MNLKIQKQEINTQIFTRKPVKIKKENRKLNKRNSTLNENRNYELSHSI